MKNLTIKIAFIACVTILLLTLDRNNLMSSSPSAPFCYAGDPVTAPVCATAGCHGGGQINTGTGNITITSTAVNNIYKTDSTYTITYTVTETGKVRFGFESVVLNNSNNAIGTFTVINAGNTYSAISSQRRFVGHVNAGTNRTWSVKWKAPSIYGGPVTFYAAGNAANGNGNPDIGDHIYKSTLVLAPFITAGISNPADEKYPVSIYPNPAVDHVSIDMANSSNDQTTIDLFDMGMKNISTVIPEKINHDHLQGSFDLSNLSKGIYYLRIRVGNDQVIKKLLITGN